jgi:hypothetical protein
MSKQRIPSLAFQVYRAWMLRLFESRERCSVKRQLMFIPMFAAAALLILVPVGEAREEEMPSDTYLGYAGAYGHRDMALAATTAVTATETRSVLGDSVPASAASPAAPGGEIGYDFLLSSMGPWGDPNYDALHPAVAYNSQDNQYLVVWAGSEDVVGEYEIWGQRVNAATGGQVGVDFQISFMGPADDPAYDAQDPDVAYNSQSNEYLVVWSADHYADGDSEIWGRRVNASTGALIGAMARVSVMGPGVDPDYDAFEPAVAYNSQDNQYLVVWEGDHDIVLVNNEFEIWGQLLTAGAEKIGTQFGLSDMGGLGDANFDARSADVAYDSIGNGYLVVWEGDSNTGLLENDEFEIWGQLLESDGDELGTNDFRISTMKGTGDADYDAYDPAVAYNRANHQYLVVWEGEGAYVNAFDIFGQRLNAYTGTGVGADDFYVSYVGSGPNLDYDALNPAVAYDPCNNEYLVVWQDDELGVGEFEVWGKRLNAATGALNSLDTRLSDMGSDGDASRIGQTPAVANSESNNQYLVVWSGDHFQDGDFEIWGQRFTGGYKVYLPLVLRDY